MMPQPELDENGLPIIRPYSPQINPNAVNPYPQQAPQPYIPQAAPIQQPGMVDSNFGHPVPITPAAPTYYENQLSAMRPPQRGDDEFKNSRLRTVLNAIAGGFAGASGGAKVGMEVGSGLRDTKFDQATEQFKRALDLNKANQSSEKEQVARAEKEVQLGIQKDQQKYWADARNRNATSAENRVDISQQRADTAADEATSKDKLRKDTVLNRQKKLDQLPPEVRSAQWFQALSPEGQESFADYELAKNPQNSLTHIEKAAEARTRGAATTAVSPLGQQAAAVTAGTKAAASTVASANAPLGGLEQSSVSAALAAAKENPDTIHDIYAKLPTPREKAAFMGQYALDPTNKWPRKLNSEEEKIRVTAGTAIGHADIIIDMLKDPDLQKSVGPIQGRLAQLAQAIGGKPGDAVANINSLDVTKGLNPASKEAKFLDLLKYLVLFEASSTSGTRPSWQLIKELKETQGAKFNLSRAIGNLEAAKTSAANRITQLFKPTSQGLDVKNPGTTPKGRTYEVVK